MSDLATLRQRALAVRAKYDELNQRDGHGSWGGLELAMGFVGDVGDLMKLVMAKEGLRRGNDVDAKLKHELADCFWSVLVLAKYYDVDLETEFLKTMDELDTRIEEMMA